VKLASFSIFISLAIHTLLFIEFDTHSTRSYQKIALRLSTIKVSKKKNTPLPSEHNKSKNSNEKTKNQNQMNSSASNSTKTSYINQVLSIINQNKRYPQRGLKLKLEANILVKFKLLSTGEIKNFTIKKKSQHEIFNQNVKDLFTRIDTFPSFPKEMKNKVLELEIPIEFIL